MATVHDLTIDVTQILGGHVLVVEVGAGGELVFAPHGEVLVDVEREFGAGAGEGLCGATLVSAAVAGRVASVDDAAAEAADAESL